MRAVLEVLTPDALQEVAVAAGAAGVLHEDGEERELGGRESHGFSGFRDLPPPDVDLQVAYDVGIGRPVLHAPEDGAHAGGEEGRAHRLLEVVGGALLEVPDGVVAGGAVTEHEDGDRRHPLEEAEEVARAL